MNLELLKDYVIDNFDPDDVVDALQISTEELVEAFPDKLEKFGYKFIDTEEEEIDEL